MTYEPGKTWRDPPAHILRHAAASTDPTGYLRRWRQRNRETLDGYADRGKADPHAPVFWSEYQDDGTELRRVSWDGGRTWQRFAGDERSLFAPCVEREAAKAAAVVRSYFGQHAVRGAANPVTRAKRKPRRRAQRLKRVVFLSPGRMGAVWIPHQF